RRRIFSEPNNRSQILRAYHRSRGRQVMLLMAAFGIALALGWGWVVRTTFTSGPSGPDPWPGAELILIAPFIFSMMLSWAGYYVADRAAYETSWGIEPPPRPFDGPVRFLVFLTRQNLGLVSIPVLLLTIEQSLLRSFPELASHWQWQVAMI